MTIGEQLNSQDEPIELHGKEKGNKRCLKKF